MLPVRCRLLRLRALSLFPDAVWDGDGKRALFIMLNPSTATEVQNDPTVERCERGRARWASARSGSSTSLHGAPPIRATCAPPPIRWGRRTMPRSSTACRGPTASSAPGAPMVRIWSRARGRGALARSRGAVDASGPVQGRPPEAPPLYRLRCAARAMAFTRLTRTLASCTVASRHLGSIT
jgi:hypothetical protein